MLVEFKLNQTSEDDKYFWKHGLIFRAGSYPDKKFKMTPQELKEAVADFKPVEVDVEHRSTPFDGKLGKLEHVELDKDGKTLYGTARFPKWVKEAFGDDAIKVSCTWDRETKKLTKLALVNNPRVSDAALMAAFSNDRLEKGEDEKKVLADFFAWFASDAKYDHTKTNKGQGQMQRMHDMSCEYGAVCDMKNKNDKSYSYFGSKEESKAIQDMHDLAVKAGAGCDFKRDYSAMYSSTEVKDNMTFKEKIQALLSSDKDEGTVDTASLSVENDEVRTLKAKVAQLEAEKTAGFKKEDVEVPVEKAPEVKALEAKVAELQAEKLKAEATAFAEDAVKKVVIVPAQKETVIKFYTQLATDDSANKAEVGFSRDGKEEKGSRLDAFKALFSALKPATLTKEEIETAGVLGESDFSEDDVVEKAKKQAEKFAIQRNKKASASA